MLRRVCENWAIISYGEKFPDIHHFGIGCPFQERNPDVYQGSPVSLEIGNPTTDLEDGRICRKAGKSKKSFSRKEAEATFKSLVKTHEKYGWVTPPVSDG
ncbi:Ubiquitin-conjugating enzyme E2Q-like protein 1 [Chelonia mydas]|uniref:Ubiquitin-conjugating enzyme E2Q-like protein 1 n=1 Tax=Chelonia mydas TaxID=8469 RepID=M7B936_CHEMY|nr:Ubiquitin-conjugating enzyme E2Q-like protein 1 [Chelonia mydas]